VIVGVFLTRVRDSPPEEEAHRERIVNEAAPRLLKLSLTEPPIASIEVRMPTRAVIPTAMIKIVKIDLNLFVLTEVSATFRFSLKSGDIIVRREDFILIA
jgi:hypothetical protein